MDEKLLAEMRERVGHRIKIWRVARKMQQGELAEALGMKQSQLSEIERGIRSIRVDQLMVIAQILTCSVSQLLGEDQKVN